MKAGQNTTGAQKQRGSFMHMIPQGFSRRVFGYLKDFVPPSLKSALFRMGFAGNRFKYGYKSWADAEAKCSGYDSNSITEALVRSSRRVVSGDAMFERDGVEFDSIQYSWPVLASLLGTPRSGSQLRVLDWGGALGSTYRQNKDLMTHAGIELNWVVVEQPHLVAIGAREFSNGQLGFTENLETLGVGDLDVVIFASSLCYVENPVAVLDKIKEKQPRAVLFDRTPFTSRSEELIGVQKVGARIYKASYPIRVFPESFLEDQLCPNYKKISEWVCDLQRDPRSVSKGMLFLRAIEI